MWQRIIEGLALTGTERKVLAFLALTFVAGLGARLYRETFPGIAPFDYRASDSTFAALSAAIEETPPEPESGDGIVRLNRATKIELMKLPGIGEVTADRILVARDEAGGFTSVNDLLKVKGISNKKLDRLRPLIRLE